MSDLSKFSDEELLQMKEALEKGVKESESTSKSKPAVEQWERSPSKYDPYSIDFVIGSGWLPAYDEPTRVSPYSELIDVASGRKETESLGEISTAARRETDAQDFERCRQQLQEKNKHISLVDSSELCCFRLAVSDDDDITPNQMRAFWTSLQGIRYPVSFEIVGNGTSHMIAFQFLCHEDDKAVIVPALDGLFPNSLLNMEGSDEDLLVSQIRKSSKMRAYGISFGLSHHYSELLPILTTFDKTDPFYALIAALAELKKNEGAVIQALVSPLEGEGSWEGHVRFIGNDENSSRREPYHRQFGYIRHSYYTPFNDIHLNNT